MSPLSPDSPFHGFRTMAFSRLVATCSGCVSSYMTSVRGLVKAMFAYYDNPVKRSIEIRQILHRAVLSAARGLAEELVHNKEVVRI